MMGVLRMFTVRMIHVIHPVKYLPGLSNLEIRCFLYSGDYISKAAV